MGRVSPAIDLGNFPNTNTSLTLGRYWTSTRYPAITNTNNYVYYININAGVISASAGPAQEGALRLVRGGQF